MAHAHSLKDSDPHFRIDPVTRNIINTSGKVVLVQHDHNSERFTFEIPRYVDGHDMSLCNNIEIHYINGSGSEKNSGMYEVTEKEIELDEENELVYCGWLISNNATKLIGPLNFMVRFECVTNGIIDYAWSTGVHSGITISQGIYNTDSIAEDYVDVLEQWKAELEDASVTMVSIGQTVTSTEDSGVNKVVMTFSDGSTGTFTVRNGSRGSQGEAFTYDDFTAEQLAGLKGEKGDAFTYEDFTEEQLAALTGPTGASIQSIKRTDGNGAAGTTDTYTITLTNGATTTFQVYNGADGDGTGDMMKSVYDPQNKATDVFAYVEEIFADAPDITIANDDKTQYMSMSDMGFVILDGGKIMSAMSDTIQFVGVEGIVTGLADPINARDAVNKQYLDSTIGDINSILDSINGETV